ncbi:hypothetical protein WJX74_009886 [Apatococcus lobatus]|uniref:SKP1-like protein n=1 Tax=Apatococcus lobatus TaxID=904363 RepID=A0AAW1QNF0_9CHLO
MASGSVSEDMVNISSSDSQTFSVKTEVANKSEMLKSFIEDASPGETIPLPTVKGAILSRILEWCKFHVDAVKETDGKAHKTKQEILDFDKEFVECPHPELFETILAANYLNIVDILKITCRKVADDIIEAGTTEGIRAKFGIENDFTPEEEAKIAEENAWVKELCPDD